MRGYLRIVLASAVLLIVTSCGAWAINVDIFDSLGQPPDTPVGFPNQAALQVYNLQEGCQGFLVGNDLSALNSVTLTLDEGISGGSGALTVALYDSTGTDGFGVAPTAPGSLVTTLVGNSDPYAAGNYTYTPSSLTVLQPNTTYYVVLSTPNYPANYPWLYTTDAAPNVGSGWWGFVYDGSGWYMGNSAGGGAYNPQLMDVNVETPEPGTLALLLMGLPLGLLWRKRKA